MSNSQVFAHGQMRLYLLALLAEGPKHGYEMMQEIEERFHGTYVPSAGSIYPRLAKLTEEGLVVRRDLGRKAVYEITEAGRAELAERRDEIEELRGTIDDSVRRLADQVRAGVAGSMGDLRNDLDRASADARRRERHRSGQGDGRNGRAARGEGAGSDRYRAAAEAARRAVGEPMHEAEEAIFHFGVDMRNMMRAADAAGLLDMAAVEELRRDLDDLLVRVRNRI